MGLVSAFNAVHNDSSRRDKPFVTINYLGFLLLFWRANFSVTKRAHSPERFSRNRVKIELAHGGTPCLDEIESRTW
jgi:DNA-binding NtrC family response regulator